jgi:hypothetical protein
VHLAQADCGESAMVESAAVDPLLNSDMCLGFELKIPLLAIIAIVVPQCPFDIDRMGVVPFDQIAVVAVHRPHQISEGGHDAFRKTIAEA